MSMKSSTKILLEHFLETRDVEKLRKQLIQLSCAVDFLFDDDHGKKKAIDDCIYLLDIVKDEER